MTAPLNTPMRHSLKPLPTAENDALLRLAKSGDNEAREKFFAHNERLLHYVVGKFDKAIYDYDERLSAVQYGFLKAYNTFDFSKEIKFATYATRCMENEMLMHMRSMKKRTGKEGHSLDEVAYHNEEGSEQTFGTMIGVADNYGFIEKDHLKSVLAEFCATAKERDQQIIHMQYVEEMDQKSIAKVLRMSQSYISRVEERILSRLKLISARKLEEERDMSKLASKIYWLLEHTALNNSEIARILDVSNATVGNYKKFFKGSDVSKLELDASAEGLMKAYYKRTSITQPKEMVPAEVEIKIEENPVTTYFIDPVVKEDAEKPLLSIEVENPDPELVQQLKESLEKEMGAKWEPVIKTTLEEDMERFRKEVILRRLASEKQAQEDAKKYPKSANLVLTSVRLDYITRVITAIELNPDALYDLVLTVKETPSAS